MSKTWGSFLVTQDMVLSHRTKFQLIINFFRLCMYFVVFLPDYCCQTLIRVISEKGTMASAEIALECGLKVRVGCQDRQCVNLVADETL